MSQWALTLVKHAVLLPHNTNQIMPQTFLNEPSQCGHVGTGDLFSTKQTTEQTPAAGWKIEMLLCTELFLIADFNLLSN